jgi:hypothetical protein
MGGISGPLGLARLRHPSWPWALLGSVLCAMGLHFGWDWIALSAPVSGELSPSQAALGVALMLAGLGLYGTLVAVSSRWSHDLFDPWRPSRLWGWPFR